MSENGRKMAEKRILFSKCGSVNIKNIKKNSGSGGKEAVAKKKKQWQLGKKNGQKRQPFQPFSTHFHAIFDAFSMHFRPFLTHFSLIFPHFDPF
jgi:hypothetical protein